MFFSVDFENTVNTVRFILEPVFICKYFRIFLFLDSSCGLMHAHTHTHIMVLFSQIIAILLRTVSWINLRFLYILVWIKKILLRRLKVKDRVTVLPLEIYVQVYKEPINQHSLREFVYQIRNPNSKNLSNVYQVKREILKSKWTLDDHIFQGPNMIFLNHFN